MLWRVPIALILLGLLGCSSTAAEQDISAPDDSESVVSDPEPTDTSTLAEFADPMGEPDIPVISDDTEITVSPVERAINFTTDPTELSEGYGKYNVATADFISKCVRLEGFDDYVHEVEPPPPPEAFLIDGTQSANLEQFGYGTTLNLRSGTISLSAPNEEVELASWELYLETLDSSAHDPFYGALSGCADEARVTIPAPQQELPAQIGEEINELRREARGSSLVMAAWDEWSRCMALEGYQFADREEIYVLLEAEAIPAREALDAVARGGEPLDSDQADEVERLIQPVAELEQRIAKVDVACVQESNVDQIANQAVHDAEQKWVDENADRVALVLAEDRPSGQNEQVRDLSEEE